jgi:hypothetical protein
MMVMPGSNCSRMPRTVSDPRSSVSSRPRKDRIRSVKTCPRSRSPAICTSSMATKAASGLLRHRFDCAHRVARTRRRNLLLPGDKRHMLGADLVDHAAIDFPRQKPQRQPDHARRVRCHPLNGVMRLAGVGRPQHRRDAAARKDHCRACRSDLESPSRTIPGRSDFVKHSKYFMNEFGGIFGFLLTSGTVLERIGDESASSGISRFVHHQILLGGLHRHL